MIGIGIGMGIITLGGAFLKGGYIALSTGIGKLGGENLVKGIIKPVARYVFFDDKNGYLRDFPNGANDDIVTRFKNIFDRANRNDQGNGD